MESLEAVQTAKDYVRQVYADEKISRPRLEELNFDRANGCWLVTIGFAYLAGDNDNSAALTPGIARAVYGDRVYKLVRINDGGGDVVGMTDRLLDPSLPS